MKEIILKLLKDSSIKIPPFGNGDRAIPESSFGLVAEYMAKKLIEEGYSQSK